MKKSNYRHWQKKDPKTVADLWLLAIQQAESWVTYLQSTSPKSKKDLDFSLLCGF